MKKIKKFLGKSVSQTEPLTISVWVNICLLIVSLIGNVLMFAIALRQADIAEDTAHHQLRAYAGIDQVKINNFHTRGIRVVSLGLKNSGQTPAYDVRGWAKMAVRKYPSSIAELGDPENILLSKFTLESGETVWMSLSHDDYTDGERAEILAGTKALYVYGEVAYKDIYNQQHRSTFNLLQGGTPGINNGEALAEAGFGNTAN
ncbi:MAG TPA: hypothetical protein V6C52_05035 [Coleofasciculaceae cyanobacterium]|jgi:hypothetical protein